MKHITQEMLSVLSLPTHELDTDAHKYTTALLHGQPAKITMRHTRSQNNAQVKRGQ